MPNLFKPQPPSDNLKIANGILPAPVPAAVRAESGLPSNYALAQLGIVTESAVAIPRVDAGSLYATSQGDYVQQTDYILTGNGVVFYDALKVDSGSQNLLDIGGALLSNTPIPTFETAPRVNELAGGESTDPHAFAVPLEATQGAVSGGNLTVVADIPDDVFYANGLSTLGETNNFDIVAAGIGNFLDNQQAAGTIDTGAGTEVVG